MEQTISGTKHNPMNKAKASYERYVGTLSLGFTLIAVGIIFLSRTFSSLPELIDILIYWPVVLIMLGVEILFSYLFFRERMRISAVSIILIFLLCVFAAVMGMLEIGIGCFQAGLISML